MGMLPRMEPAGKKTATFVTAQMEKCCAQRYVNTQSGGQIYWHPG